MHALNPCVARPVVASAGAEPHRITDGAKTFGATLTAQARAPGSRATGPGSAQGDGPLRNRKPVVPSALVDAITKLRRDERTLDRYLRRALAGHDFDMPQLVALQSLAFKYSQRVELMGKLVDRLTGAMKQTLQMQV